MVETGKRQDTCIWSGEGDMSNDKIQRQMDFILEQQARFNDDMIKLEEKTRRNTEDITKLVGAIGALIDHGMQTDRRIDELAVRGKETDARLNTLISVVERYYSNGQKN
jgi:hypothetical protein